MYELKNEELTVSIQHEGIELASVIDNKNKVEYIWQADPNVWGSHAPVLFPIIGGLKNDQYHYQDTTYSLPKHGFVRRNPNLRVVTQSAQSITFELSNSPALQLIYPFEFSFRVTYRLEGRRLYQEHHIVNSSNSEPLYFSLGGHPAFKIPQRKDEQYADYYLAFEQTEDALTHSVNSEGLIGPITRPVAWQENRLSLTHDLFSKDALVFKDLKSRIVDLVSAQHGKLLTVRYNDFNYLGIWAKPNGNFICIEPWLGIADNHDTDGDFTKKEGIIKLAGSKSYEASFSIDFHEQS